MGPNSTLMERHDKILVRRYVRTLKELDRKHQVVSSTGKHTNAVLSCLEWMKQNLADYVKHSREFFNETDKREFFSMSFYNWHILRKHALEISEPATTKMLSSAVPKKIQQHHEFKQNIAEWVLISMSKNKQHVKAIDADFSKKNR